ncbi:phosphonate C-P lyase system protein PhnH [Azorhizobium doebereinerae]|uniref:phosphonate C-P lyase system protein PhnH n=1 Tax=Azorhizobium doebereinerae TaxID=281091 RepID=UPI0004162D30|nr:phosphonate C-P lyase system protein PhnH [Azorhizobium doebereinerae]
MPALALGFADPVRDSQAAFKALMWAMAQPGDVVPLDTRLAPPAPLTPEMAASALALIDYETPVWLDPALAAAPETADFLRFHTGAPLTGDPAAARFALVADPAALPAFDSFAQGEPDYPDRSTTLILAVERFDAAPLVLEGPGIKGWRGFGAHPLPADFAARLAANRALFPLGLDLILTAPGAVAALPRSVRLQDEG